MFTNIVQQTITKNTMKEIKAQFKDVHGFYTMIFSFNPDLWEAKDIIQNECQNSNSQFIQFLTI